MAHILVHIQIVVLNKVNYHLVHILAHILIALNSVNYHVVHILAHRNRVHYLATHILAHIQFV